VQALSMKNRQINIIERIVWFPKKKRGQKN